MLTHRVFSIAVAAAFLACQVAVCACRSPRAAAPVKKAEAHSCCSKHASPPVEKKAPARESKSCCCSDGAHLAVAPDAPPATEQAEVQAAAMHALPRHAAPDAACEVTGSPPSRASTVSLYTLHGSLLI
ncbi:MAG: hypothetical protein HYY18_06180 [Planctomycetes bacterium]|nr:hypothetical protein [Planctomycetota bacterium]